MPIKVNKFTCWKEFNCIELDRRGRGAESNGAVFGVVAADFIGVTAAVDPK